MGAPTSSFSLHPRLLLLFSYNSTLCNSLSHSISPTQPSIYQTCLERVEKPVPPMPRRTSSRDPPRLASSSQSVVSTVCSGRATTPSESVLVPQSTSPPSSSTSRPRSSSLPATPPVTTRSPVSSPVTSSSPSAMMRSSTSS